MPKFLIDWSINGTTEIDAADKEQAELVFNQISKREHAESGDLEMHAEPETQEDRESAWERWKALIDKGRKHDQPTRDTVPSSSGVPDVRVSRGGAGGGG